MENIFLNEEKCFLVTKKGRTSGVLFTRKSDYRYYSYLMRKLKKKYQINIFAFCLLPDAVHMVLQPREDRALGIFIEQLKESYALYRQSRYQCNGTLWQRNHRRTCIKSDRDLFAHIKFVEFLPVNARLVLSPLEYVWSSCSHRVVSDNGILDTVPGRFAESRNIVR